MTNINHLRIQSISSQEVATVLLKLASAIVHEAIYWVVILRVI